MSIVEFKAVKLGSSSVVVGSEKVNIFIQPLGWSPSINPAWENEVFAKTNEARSQGRYCGDTYYPPAPSLRFNSSLAMAARKHSMDMGNNMTAISHIGSDGSSISLRVEREGYRNWIQVGENISGGYSLEGAVKGFLSSPLHCKNLMSPNFKDVGIGYYYKPGSQYGVYWTQDFGAR